MLPDRRLSADYANLHNYVSSFRRGYLDNQAWQTAYPGINTVLVNLGRIFARVAISDITSERPFQVLHNIDSLSLTVGDRAMIVEVE